MEFQNICNEIGWPRFLRHPVVLNFKINKHQKINAQKFTSTKMALIRMHTAAETQKN